MTTGVYNATKKDGSVYYRVSITYKNKHISIGSYDSEELASMAYITACDIISKPDIYYIDADLHTTSYELLIIYLLNYITCLIILYLFHMPSL